MGTPESSVSAPPPASEAPPERSKRRGWIVLLVLLVVAEAAAWGWARLKMQRATALYFGNSYCWVFDCQPSAYVLAINAYVPGMNPLLGSIGSGWTGSVNPVNQPFVTDPETHLGFGWGQWRDDGYGGTARYVRIPHPAILTALLVLTIHLCWKSYRYIAPGCCRQCGYDLRATPDRCPECGAVPAK